MTTIESARATETVGMLPAARRLATGWFGRTTAAASGALGAIAGLTPHVLHHIAPIAGAALLTGAGGTALFGALGFVLTVPMLLKLRRRFGSWLAPTIALTLFAVMFTVSTLWMGPAIRGDGGTPADAVDHNSHH